MSMTGTQLRAFRNGLELTQAEFATLIDLSVRKVIYLESDAVVPRTIELACAALAYGVSEYQGALTEYQVQRFARRRRRFGLAA